MNGFFFKISKRPAGNERQNVIETPADTDR